MTTLIDCEQRVTVGIADVAVSNKAEAVLMTCALGSCLGIAIHDPVARVGGLLHTMLPDSSIDSARALSHPAMFIDTGVPALLRMANKLGAEKHRLLIYVAGGAQIVDGCGYFNIGKRNREALSDLLRQHGLRIESERTGGMVNRTMYLDVGTGAAIVKVSGQRKEIHLCKS